MAKKIDKLAKAAQNTWNLKPLFVGDDDRASKDRKSRSKSAVMRS